LGYLTFETAGFVTGFANGWVTERATGSEKASRKIPKAEKSDPSTLSPSRLGLLCTQPNRAEEPLPSLFLSSNKPPCRQS